MKQGDEIVFSFAKYKLELKKYFFIIIICILLAIVYIGLSIIKNNKLIEQDKKMARAVDDISEVQPEKDVFLKKMVFVGVDWSDEYPEPDTKTEISVDDGEKITNMINGQIQIERNILSSCSPIISYKTYIDQINSELEKSKLDKLSEKDTIGYVVYSEKQYGIYVYSQSSIKRTEKLLDIANDVFENMATKTFGIGNTEILSYTDVKIAIKKEDGSYTDKDIIAKNYIKDNKIENVVDESSGDERLVVSARDEEKNVVIIGIVAILLAGFIIVGVISLFDTKIYWSGELDGLYSANVIDNLEYDNGYLLGIRLKKKADKNSWGKLALISLDEKVNDEMMNEIRKGGVDVCNFVYSKENIIEILNSNVYRNAIILVKSGIDSRKEIAKIAYELNLDDINLIGYILQR